MCAPVTAAMLGQIGKHSAQHGGRLHVSGALWHVAIWYRWWRRLQRRLCCARADGACAPHTARGVCATEWCRGLCVALQGVRLQAPTPHHLT
jgi:hypothetical protein